MKCAAAVIRSSSVRPVLLSIQIVKNAGIWGAAKDTIQLGRPWIVRATEEFRVLQSGPPSRA